MLLFSCFKLHDGRWNSFLGAGTASWALEQLSHYQVFLDWYGKGLHMAYLGVQEHGLGLLHMAWGTGTRALFIAHGMGCTGTRAKFTAHGIGHRNTGYI